LILLYSIITLGQTLFLLAGIFYL